MSQINTTPQRVEPLGWDREGRTLFVLDDNRLYRQTDPPPPPPPSKAKSKAKKKKTKGTRSSKRRKTETPPPEDGEEDENDAKPAVDAEDDGLGGAKWECLCITLEEYQAYMGTLRRSKDVDEQELYQNLDNDVLPIIERQAEEQAKKEARRMKELEVQMKLATAKRSSRISSRVEKQREAEAAAEAERKRLEDIAMAKAEQEKMEKMEQVGLQACSLCSLLNFYRSGTLGDRHGNSGSESVRPGASLKKRVCVKSKRMKRNSQQTKQMAVYLKGNSRQRGSAANRNCKGSKKRRSGSLTARYAEYMARAMYVFPSYFLCPHKLTSDQDDGTHIIACDKCNVWQHSKCHNISASQADKEDFQFICSSCKRKEEQEKLPKLPPLKLRLNASSPNSHPPAQTNGNTSTVPRKELDSVQVSVEKPFVAEQKVHPVHTNPSLFNGPSLSPRGQAVGPPGIQISERPEAPYGSPYLNTNGSSPVANRSFSSGHPGRSFASNGQLASSPPPFQLPNGKSLNTSRSMNNLPFGGSFSRPSSSAGPGPYSSPVKHSPAASPKPTNGIPHYNLMNSPHSSFPPATSQQPCFSPTKHSSPPPPLPYMSSPAPMPAPISHPPTQLSASMLPNPIPAPEKHDGARPVSSHSISQTHVFPPVESLSPSAKPINLSPPVKRSSPAPERLPFQQGQSNGQ